MMIKYIIIL